MIVRLSAFRLGDIAEMRGQILALLDAMRRSMFAPAQPEAVPDPLPPPDAPPADDHDPPDETAPLPDPVPDLAPASGADAAQDEPEHQSFTLFPVAAAAVALYLVLK